MGGRGGQEQEGEWLPGCRVGATLGERAGKERGKGCHNPTSDMEMRGGNVGSSL